MCVAVAINVCVCDMLLQPWLLLKQKQLQIEHVCLRTPFPKGEKIPAEPNPHSPQGKTL